MVEWDLAMAVAINIHKVVLAEAVIAEVDLTMTLILAAVVVIPGIALVIPEVIGVAIAVIGEPEVMKVAVEEVVQEEISI